MTTNEHLIVTLTKLCDVSQYAIDQKVTAYSLVTALLHEAMGGAMAANEPKGWDKLRDDALMIIRAVKPTTLEWRWFLSQLRRDMIDLEYAAND